MERLKLKFEDSLKASGTLEKILKEPFSIIVRDATIQRFEYTFEILWKFLKEYIKEEHGIIINSPKSCFREIFSLGIITAEETEQFLEMTDKRNETSHTYKEEVAQAIFVKMNEFSLLINNLLSKFSLNKDMIVVNRPPMNENPEKES